MAVPVVGSGNSGRCFPESLAARRFHNTVLNEFYRVAFRKKLYGTLEELQADLDA